MRSVRVTIRRRLAARVLCVFSAAAFAHGQAWEAVPLGTLGGAGSAAFGVNDAGQVVGASDTEDGAIHAFVWEDGAMTDLGTLTGGADSTAYSINNAGVIAGRSKNAIGVDRAVKWEKDESGEYQILDLGTFTGAGFAWATRINNAGQITGYATAQSGAYHAFLWTSGVMADLGTLHFTGNRAYSQGLGLNDAGQTVGFAYATFQGPEHGFFHDGTQQIDLTPPEQFGLAQGHNVNSAGFIAGYLSSSQTSGAFRAAVWNPNTSSWDLIPPVENTSEGYGYDINESGAVVGTSFEAGLPSVFHGFYYSGGQVLDLNDVTTGLVGPISEAPDISNTGLIAANSDGPAGPAGLLLRPTTPCVGDLDGDVTVGLGDLAILLSHFGTTGGAQPGDGDLTGDGAVDLGDLALLLGAFGTNCD
jgi:probable HAF family extracellular repeat protein